MHLGTRTLTLTVAGVSRTADVSDCRIVSEPMPPEEQQLCRPNRRYRLQGTAAQDVADGSLWGLVWDHVDEKVTVDLRPAGGGDVPSPEQPHFVGTVTVTEPDGDLLGGAADPSTGGRFVFAVDWVFDEKPTRVTAPPEDAA